MKLLFPTFTFRSICATCLILFASLSFPAQAAEPFTVKDIRIEGLRRTEVGTVFGYFPIRVGDTYTDSKATSALKALYATGFFKDVSLDVDGDVLVIIVDERPAIAEIDFVGTKEFDEEMLLSALKGIGLGTARIFDRSLVERAEQELKRQYLSRSLYSVDVSTTVTPVERNRVAITFTVDEGEPARIHQINFVGNETFSDDDLIDQMSLTTPGWLTWLTKTDQYSKQKLSADIESLKSYYQNQGYIDMQVASTQVSITPDKKDIYVTININEGKGFTISEIKVEGTLFEQKEKIESLITLKPGDVYSREEIALTAKNISEHMGNFGYAFANVNPYPELDREKNEVAFTFFVDPGKRVYVRKINFGGNTKTRDEVIRREFRQMESSWYNGEKIKLSRDRVDRLGYFTEVSLETPAVPETNDQVDVNMTVVEKPTGNVMLGAGFSQSENFMLEGSIEQDNFAGTGNKVGLSANTSSRYRSVGITQTNPYFTDDGISRTYDLYLKTTRPPLVNTGDYKVQSTGATVRFGVPFTELDRVYFGVGIDQTKVTTFDDGTYQSPLRYQEFVSDLNNCDTNSSTCNPGEASALSVPMTISWRRDGRDSALVPTKGEYQRAAFETSLVGDLKYYKATYQHQYYWPITRTMTFAVNGQIDYGAGIGDNPYPVFKNVYAGGIGTVRGYESSSICAQGSCLDDNGDAVGGSKRLFANVELQMPLGDGQDRTLRWFTFFDVGSVWDEDMNIDAGDLRYSAGVGISWVSPIGPLKLSYGFPLNAEDTDSKQQFQFQIGTGF